MKKSFPAYILLIILCSTSAFPANEPETPATKNQTPAQELSEPLAELALSITSSIDQEQINTGAALKKLVEEKSANEKLEKEIGLHKILASSAQNLLLIPNADIDLLTKNLDELKASRSALESKLQEIKTSSADNIKQIQVTDEKIQIGQKQIDTIKK